VTCVVTDRTASFSHGYYLSKLHMNREVQMAEGQVVPRQYSTGGRQRLLRINKWGNAYLRRMLTHGARAALLRAKYSTGGFGQWVHG
jgi:hypothetical protein